MFLLYLLISNKYNKNITSHIRASRLYKRYDNHLCLDFLQTNDKLKSPKVNINKYEPCLTSIQFFEIEVSLLLQNQTIFSHTRIPTSDVLNQVPLPSYKTRNGHYMSSICRHFLMFAHFQLGWWINLKQFERSFVHPS